MKPRDGFDLPVVTPVIGAQALVGLAILLILTGQASIIARFIDGWMQ